MYGFLLWKIDLGSPDQNQGLSGSLKFSKKFNNNTPRHTFW